jgi:aspartate/methionine/tyrosine aminotransferase
MTGATRTKRSIYMEWAKTRSHARFNLATSGVMSVPIAEFPVQMKDLEITAPGAYGNASLQERLAKHNHVPVQCVVPATGTSMANHLAMAAVLDPGDEVLIEQPVYGPLLDVAEYLGARIKRIARKFETGFAIDVDELQRITSRETRLIVLSNLHNPSGALLSAETLRAIGEIAQRAGARVLVDEVYLEMLFETEKPFSFHIGKSLAADADNPFIVTSSLTKVYGLSGLRCGWILASPDLAKRMWLLNDLYGAVAAHAAERMSVIAFDHLEQFRSRTRALLATNRALLDAFLDSRRDLECFRPVAGTVVFPRLTNCDAQQFFQLLREEYETTVVPGSFFEMPQHFRIGIGGDTENLQAGLERLSAALDDFGKSDRGVSYLGGMKSRDS